MLKMLKTLKAAIRKAPGGVLEGARRAGVQLGENVSMLDLPPRIRNAGSIRLHDGVTLRGTLQPIGLTSLTGGHIEVGADTFINTGARIISGERVTIGAGCRIGDNAVICDSDFHEVHEGQTIRPKAIVLGRNVWIGRSAQVMRGVTIGDHSILAAGGVAFEDIPPRQIWRGNPAVFYRDVSASDAFQRS